MSHSTQLCSADYQELLAVVGEMGELAATGNAAAALDHLLARISQRLAAASSMVVLNYPEGTAHTSRPPPWQVGHLVVHGLDEWQQRFWRDWFIECKGQFEHPLFLSSVRRAGQRRSHAREELVADDEWYGSAFVNDCLRKVDFDHSISTVTPLDGRTELVLAAARHWGSKRLSARDLAWLETLSKNVEWLLPLYLNNQAASQTPPRLEVPRLSPRLNETLQLLLGGKSEGQIAEAMNLSPRSAHKYVERVYRAFDVHTRAELMALWTGAVDRGNGPSDAS